MVSGASAGIYSLHIADVCLDCLHGNVCLYRTMGEIRELRRLGGDVDNLVPRVSSLDEGDVDDDEEASRNMTRFP